MLTARHRTGRRRRGARLIAATADPAVSWFMIGYAAQIDEGEHLGHDATIGVQVAAIAHLLHAAAARGIAPRLAELHLA